MILENLPNLKREEYYYLYNAIGMAIKNGLLMEFLESFSLDYNQTKSIISAVNFANREWDL